MAVRAVVEGPVLYVQLHGEHREQEKALVSRVKGPSDG